MSRFILFVLVVGIAALMVTGVLQVSFDADSLGEAPTRLLTMVTSRRAIEDVRASTVRTKRSAEQWAIKDSEHRLEIAVDYVATDAERLADMAEALEQSDPEALLPQAELLIKSIDRVGDLLSEVPAGVVVSTREDLNNALQGTHASLAVLQQIGEEHAEQREDFAQVSSVLAWHLGELDPDGDGLRSTVAGDSDEAARDEGDAENETEDNEGDIPLSF